MKFLLDMPVSPSLVGWFQRQGHEAVHAQEIGLNEAEDTEIAKLAVKEGRIVITADLDFGLILAMSGNMGPGVILFRGGNYSDLQMQELLGRVLEVVAPEILEQAIAVVDRKRVRVTRLPLRKS